MVRVRVFCHGLCGTSLVDASAFSKDASVNYSANLMERHKQIAVRTCVTCWGVFMHQTMVLMSLLALPDKRYLPRTQSSVLCMDHCTYDEPTRPPTHLRDTRTCTAKGVEKSKPGGHARTPRTIHRQEAAQQTRGTAKNTHTH